MSHAVILNNDQAEPGKGTGRNRVIDFKPDGVDGDPDYQKFQREVSSIL
jgi:hypothetical protein